MIYLLARFQVRYMWVLGQALTWHDALLSGLVQLHRMYVAQGWYYSMRSPQVTRVHSVLPLCQYRQVFGPLHRPWMFG